MPAPAIHGNPRQIPPYSANAALAAVADALGEIKTQDRLTWADLGAVLGKSDDQAAKYADGSACMDIVTYGRARRAWGSRFTGYFDRLCEAAPSAEAGDRESESLLLMAALALSQALAGDGRVTAAEVKANRPVLERARDALVTQLSKI